MAFRLTILVAALLLAIPTIADAKPKHRTTSQAVITCDDRGCSDMRSGNIAAGQHAANVNEGGQIVAHPDGCPSRLFCGCGVSVKVFGKPVRNLFLASNWLKFPRATPSAGMVAARKGHVFYILDYLGGGNALAYDPNSGGRKTRIHVRSLAGYRVVDPHARRVAGL